MKLYLILGASLLLGFSGASAQEKKPDPKFHIYLCFGQSNMEAGARPDAEDKGELDPRFQVLAAVDMPRLNRTKGNWYVATPPLNRQENNMGPVDWFGRNMVANLPKDVRVGVINVSVAGAGIELWDKDDWQKYLDTREQWMKNIVKQYDGSPYARLVEMGKIAKKDGVIKGILLHQGESNSSDTNWPVKVKAIFDNLMKDLDLNPKEVPLLAGELKSEEEHGVCFRFNTNILVHLPEVLPNSYIISSKGVKGTPDQFHFNTAGMRELGKRYAIQMLMLEGIDFKEVDRPGLLPVAAVASTSATALPVSAPENHWVGSWGCGIQLVEPRNLPPAPGLSTNTLREIVHSTIGGKQLRVRFSNVFGTNTVEMKSVHIALAPGAVTSSTIDPATDKALKFNGAESVAIPAGKDIWSDPVAFELPPLTNLAITIAFGQTSGDITGHPSSRCDSYILPGNAVTSVDMAGAIKTEHWYNIEDVDVMSDAASGAIVTFGDSITDGRGSTTGHNNRWPDILALRLHTNAPTAHVSVINTGIGGNAIYGGLGPAGVKRFDRDVLDQSGVRWVIIFEGVNDIGGARGPAAATLATNLIAAYKEFASKAHERKIRIYGATITPFEGSNYYSEQHEAIRQDVNAWIRTNSVFDGVIDFDAAVRDPASPGKFKAEYHPGLYANDWLHLNAAGYQAMGDAIDLKMFAK